MKRWLTIVCWMCLLMPVWAQQMEVVDFIQQKKGFLGGLFKKDKVTTDKTSALLDFRTGEQGFEFKADGTTAIKAEEGEGMQTLKIPHKTRFLVIKHPDYGQLTWKVPKKPLKKKKHYQATLLTFSPDKTYKLQKQWVVFKVEPMNAILTVDSTTTLIRNGDAQLNLSLGKHTYRVESPFFEAKEDSFELTDSAKLILPVTLQSIYSYVTVRTSLRGCDIRLDGASIGKTIATSGHLQPGVHRLSVFRGSFCYYDKEILVEPTEKKVIELGDNDLSPRLVSQKQMSRLKVPAATDSVASDKASPLRAFVPTVVQAPVTIEAANDSTEIIVDLEPVGFGKWEGTLTQGFHTVNTRLDGVESRIQYLWIDDELPKAMRLLAPTADYGVLNIHSNVVGAEIYINGVMMGVTPCVIEKLSPGKACTVRLVKEGYRPVEKTVKIIANDMVEEMIEMKKRKTVKE